MKKKKPQRLKSFQELAHLPQGGPPQFGPSANGSREKGEARHASPSGQGAASLPLKTSGPGNPGGGGCQSGLYPLPKDVRKNLDWKQCQNFSLAFQRYIPYEQEKYDKNKKGIWQVDKTVVWPRLEAMSKALFKAESSKQFLERQEALIVSLINAYGEERLCTMVGKTESRLSIGFGNASPLETGLTLHRLYGLPLLPGTAVKGLCRAWKLEQLGAKYGVPLTCRDKLEEIIFAPDLRTNQKVKERLEKLWSEIQTDATKNYFDLWQDGESCRRAFGSQKVRGEVVFYDAYPAQVPTKGLERDIINVHYQKYYENPDNPPADYLNPVPIVFLAVPAGVRFRFFLTAKDQKLLKDVASWLKPALAEFGIGAKTAVGYGEISITEERNPCVP